MYINRFNCFHCKLDGSRHLPGGGRNTRIFTLTCPLRNRPTLGQSSPLFATFTCYLYKVKTMIKLLYSFCHHCSPRRVPDYSAWTRFYSVVLCLLFFFLKNWISTLLPAQQTSEQGEARHICAHRSRTMAATIYAVANIESFAPPHSTAHTHTLTHTPPHNTHMQTHDKNSESQQ